MLDKFKKNLLILNLDPKHMFFIALEMFIVNSIIFGFYFVLNPQRETFIHMNIHPFVMFTALIGLRYGNYIALINAFVSMILFVIAYVLLGKDFTLFFSDFNHYKFILMFFLSAVIFGFFKDSYALKVFQEREEKKNLQNDYEQLTKIHEKTKFIKDELKKQIIGTEDSILSLYDIASSLESIEPEQLYTEIMGVLHGFLKAKTVSIYVLNSYKSYLRLKVRMGWDSELSGSIKVEDNPHFQTVIQDKQAVSMKSADKSIPLMIAPIINNGDVIGIINIEELEFGMITEYTFNLFKVIVDWTSKAMTRALLVTDSIKIDKYYKDTILLKYNLFLERLKEEERRKDKYGLDYILLKYKSNGFSVETINENIKGAVRQDVDVVSFDKVSKTLHVLFPVCQPDLLSMMEDRIQAKFDYKLEKIA